MLPSSTKPTRIGLSTQHVVTVAGGQFLSFGSTVSNVSATAPAKVVPDFDQVLHLTREALQKIKATERKGAGALPRWFGGNLPGVAYVLDNTWVRVFVCRWDEALRTTKDFTRYAQIEFERRFHSSSVEWTLVPDGLRPGGETVFCAYRGDQLKGLKGLADEAGFSIYSALPVIMAEIAAQKFVKASSPLIYIGSGNQSKTICWIEDSRLRDLILLRSDAVAEGALLDLFSERLKLSSAVQQIEIVHAQSSPSETLRMLVEGHRPKTTTSSFHASGAELVS